MEYFISIDFGTCNSVISFLEDNNILQIENINNGDVLIPTTIYFLSNELNDNLKIGDLKPNIHYLIGNEANDNVSINKDTEYYFNRALFDTFHLLIGIIIPLIFIYKLYKTRKNN